MHRHKFYTLWQHLTIQSEVHCKDNYGGSRQNLTWWVCRCWRHSEFGYGEKITNASSATSSYTSRHTCWMGRSWKVRRVRPQCMHAHIHTCTHTNTPHTCTHACIDHRLTGTAGCGTTCYGRNWLYIQDEYRIYYQSIAMHIMLLCGTVGGKINLEKLYFHPSWWQLLHTYTHKPFVFSNIY